MKGINTLTQRPWEMHSLFLLPYEKYNRRMVVYKPEMVLIRAPMLPPWPQTSSLPKYRKPISSISHPVLDFSRPKWWRQGLWEEMPIHFSYFSTKTRLVTLTVHTKTWKIRLSVSVPAPTQISARTRTIRTSDLKSEAVFITSQDRHVDVWGSSQNTYQTRKIYFSHLKIERKAVRTDPESLESDSLF